MILTQTPRAKAIAAKKMNGSAAFVPEKIIHLNVIQETPTLVRLPDWSSTITEWVVWAMFPIAHPILFLVALVRFPAKALAFAWVILGGRVSANELADRTATCANCKDCQRTVRVSGGVVVIVSAYCGLCGCGKWIMARLGIKNRFRRWECPRGRHTLTQYRIDPFIEYAKQNGYETQLAEWKYEKAGSPKKSKGCGG